MAYFSPINPYSIILSPSFAFCPQFSTNKMGVKANGWYIPCGQAYTCKKRRGAFAK